MAWLKAYEWERTKFPIGKLINIRSQYRRSLTLKLGQYFKLVGLRVELCLRGNGGRASYPALIKLPCYECGECSLGNIYHELAHILNYQNYNERGHTGSFKDCLIKIYVESKRQLPRIFMEIRQELYKQQEVARKESERQQRQAERKVQQKELSKTRPYKIERLKVRIKKLESKRKRIETILKFANRSLKILERFAALEQIKTETHSSQRATA